MFPSSDGFSSGAFSSSAHKALTGGRRRSNRFILIEVCKCERDCHKDGVRLMPFALS
jgi:hypothetical protein